MRSISDYMYCICIHVDSYSYLLVIIVGFCLLDTNGCCHLHFIKNTVQFTHHVEFIARLLKPIYLPYHFVSGLGGVSEILLMERNYFPHTSLSLSDDMNMYCRQ